MIILNLRRKKYNKMDKAEQLFAIFSGLTGLSVDDLVEQVMEENPEKAAELEARNLAKMFEYQE